MAELDAKKALIEGELAAFGGSIFLDERGRQEPTPPAAPSSISVTSMAPASHSSSTMADPGPQGSTSAPR